MHTNCELFCVLECQLQEAYSQCHCIPWNYPHFKEGIPICNRFSQECFEKTMADTNSSSTCDCPFDCATTRHCVQNDINSFVVYFRLDSNISNIDIKIVYS